MKEPRGVGKQGRGLGLVVMRRTLEFVLNVRASHCKVPKSDDAVWRLGCRVSNRPWKFMADATLGKRKEERIES
jgi:hypothetical protein